MKNQPSTFAYAPDSLAVEVPVAHSHSFGARVRLYFQRLTPQSFLVALLALAVALAIYSALQQPAGLAWLFQIKRPISDQPFPDDVGKALGPILALALMIERLLETIFNVFERNWAQVARFGTSSSEGVNILNRMLTLYSGQLNTAVNALETAMDNPDPAVRDGMAALILKVDEAEVRVREASAKFASLTSDVKYLAWKRTITIWLGLTLGLIVAVVSDKGVFEYLNMGVPRLLDMLVTGFVIGAGSGPMHSLIGLLQSAKTTLDNVGSLTGVSALQKDVQELKDTINKNNG
jgi:hypothetical protein